MTSIANSITLCYLLLTANCEVSYTHKSSVKTSKTKALILLLHSWDFRTQADNWTQMQTYYMNREQICNYTLQSKTISVEYAYG